MNDAIGGVEDLTSVACADDLGAAAHVAVDPGGWLSVRHATDWALDEYEIVFFAVSDAMADAVEGAE